MIADFENKKILIISPHPDDLEIGMGGTAFILSKKNQIYHIICTNGSGSTNEFSSKEVLIQKRKDESKQSNNFLKVKESKIYKIDHIKNNKNKLEFIKLFKKDIKKIRPDILFCTHPKLDNHPTHRKISREIMKIINKNKIKIFYYQVWGCFNKFNYYVDISKVVEKKKKMINFHKSQTSYKDYVQGIIGLNKYHAVFNNIKKDDEAYIEVFI